MTQPSNIHHQLYKGAKLLVDPGDGGTIRPIRDLQLCEMVSTATETRTLANPSKAGIRFMLRMLTDGGDIVVTAANGLNSSLNTQATFADAGDFLWLLSVSLTSSTYRWEVLEGNVGTVISSFTASHTPSHTSSPSHTASFTPSHTASHTASRTPSHTASHTTSPSST